MSSAAADHLIEASGVTKRFPGVIALDRADFELRAGEVHALLGENGAGKSTLTRIIAGDYAPDEGELRFSGQPVALSSPRDALERGVRLVTQERALVPTLSVAENILLGRLPVGPVGTVDWAEARRVARQMLNRLGMTIEPTHEVGQLRPAEQQLVEIAEALSAEGRILILDEPTAALSTTETERLFEVIRGLRARGVGVLYITHRVGELAMIADRITVLRDGRVIATRAIADTNRQELVRLMVGREITEYYPRARPEPGEVALELDRVSSAGVCDEVSIHVRAGEIVALFGLVGSGATEIPYAAAGHLAHSGQVKVRGRVGLVPVDRRSEGLFLQATVRRNIGAATLSRYSPLGIYRRRLERIAANRQIQTLELRPPHSEGAITVLSGGNQQKTVLGRWLAADVDVLLLSEPTRGVDVGARAEIYAVLGGLCEQGTAILAASSDLDEVVGLADRVYIVADGKVVAELGSGEITSERVLEAATR